MSSLKNKISFKHDGDVILRALAIHQGFEVHRQYLEVLADVNLEIIRGEMVAITGVSGSGKSTLLNILAGLDAPQSGEVWFNGKNITKMREGSLATLRNECMGFVFQQHHLIRELTVLENVMLPGMVNQRLARRPTTMEEIQQKALDLIEQVGLTNRGDHLIGELSGGETQRTAVARALIHDPLIVFADEPTGNLDENNSLETFAILRNLTQQNDSSIVIVTHSKELTYRCDKIYTIDQKKLVHI